MVGAHGLAFDGDGGELAERELDGEITVGGDVDQNFVDAGAVRTGRGGWGGGRWRETVLAVGASEKRD